MNYGSSSYGSVAFGGLQASRFAFYTFSDVFTAGTYQRFAEYLGSAQFFEVTTRLQGALEDLNPRTMRIYSHNDPSETPQLQVSVGLEAEATQSIVGAARFIVVEIELPVNTNPSLNIFITGNEYFQ